MKPKQEDPKEMVGGCCVCSDENGWTENPLVYCDGVGCNVAVHQACYGIVAVPTGSWFCRKCESQERSARVRCELCPSKDGALKRTDTGGWAHVVCALYIPEVRFGNVTTMEPIMLQIVPQERFNKLCYLCEEANRGNKANIGAVMQCNRSGCKNHFHVTCAQAMGLLCEEAGNYLDNVKYCGYCQYHYNKLRRGSNVKTIPPYRPVCNETSSDEEKCGPSSNPDSKFPAKFKRRSSKSSPPPDPSKLSLKDNHNSENPLKANDLVTPLECNSNSNSDPNTVSDKKNIDSFKLSEKVINNTNSSTNANSVGKVLNANSTIVNNKFALSNNKMDNSNLSINSSSVGGGGGDHQGEKNLTGRESQSLASETHSNNSKHANITVIKTESSAQSGIGVKLKIGNNSTSVSSSHNSSHTDKDKYKRKFSKSSPRSNSIYNSAENETLSSTVTESDKEEGVLTICEERNLSIDQDGSSAPSQETKTGGLHASSHPQNKKGDSIDPDFSFHESMKRPRSGSQDRGRRTKRGSHSFVGPSSKRGRFVATVLTKDVPPKDGNHNLGDDSSSVNLDSQMLHLEAPMKRGRPCKVPDSPKDSKDALTSLITNGLSTNTLLLGNQINPSSSMAQKMTDALNAEIEAHSIYKQEEKFSTNLVGPTLPGKKENPASGNALNSGAPPPLPQSLEELLERQWEQGSQFLMDQSQHFDIASLLSCLHQLRQENVRLEETVSKLVARRDHLLAVNARLSVPLATTSQPPSTSVASSSVSAVSGGHAPGGSHSGSPVSSSSSGHGATVYTYANSASASVGGTSGPNSASSPFGGHAPAPPTSSSASVLTASRHHAPHHRHPTDSERGGSHAVHSAGGANHLNSRGSSPHDRRSHHSGAPLENGLGGGDHEFRYRSPAHGNAPDLTPHRQHSPLLPRGAQPSPTSMRQSPASSNYRSSASPHSGVASVSPSSGGGASAPHPHHAPHAGSNHGGTAGGTSTPGSVSSSHGGAAPHGSSHHHTVSLSRISSDHSRAELVRITSAQPHSSSGHSAVPVSGYPVYQMVSPPVHGAHHSPVGLAQHPQVVRREVVESGRSSHAMDSKR